MTRLNMIGDIRTMLPRLWEQDRFELAKEIMGEIHHHDFTGVPEKVVAAIWRDLKKALDVRETITERVVKAVHEWPDWSRAERAKIDEIVEEVLAHCRNGEGNTFIRCWCRENLTAAVTGPLFTG